MKNEHGLLLLSHSAVCRGTLFDGQAFSIESREPHVSWSVIRPFRLPRWLLLLSYPPSWSSLRRQSPRFLFRFISLFNFCLLAEKMCSLSNSFVCLHDEFGAGANWRTGKEWKKLLPYLQSRLGSDCNVSLLSICSISYCSIHWISLFFLDAVWY